jgi:hypothetical protein
MNTGVRLGAFAVALAAVFAGAWATGAAVTPLPPQAAAEPAPTASGPREAGYDPNHDSDHAGAAHGPQSASTRPPTGQDPVARVESLGLASTQAGYTFVPQNTSFTLGTPGELAFTVTGPGGQVVTGYDDTHHGALQVVVVRRDAAGFQHLQPTLGADGVWRAPLTLPGGGVWRAYADFAPAGGPPLVLGTDLFVQGDFTPFRFTESRAAEVDGYQVRLDGTLTPGARTQLYLTVSRGGAPVLDLEPYLGAFGHLVALRQGDLAYLAVQPITSAPPAPTDRAGPGVAFTVDVPSTGAYRLFAEFVHGGAVHTAEFSALTPER